MDAPVDQHSLKSGLLVTRLKSIGRSWIGNTIGLVIWSFLLSIIIYQQAARMDVAIGDYYDRPYLGGAFSDRETSADNLRTFRWTTGTAAIELPNSGRGSWVAHLDSLTSHPDGSLVQAVIRFADAFTVTLPDLPERRITHFFIPASATGSGNLRLELSSSLYQEPSASARTLGIALFGFSASTTASRPLFPPPAMFLFLTLIVVLSALTLAITGLPKSWSVGGAAVLGSGLALLLMFDRAPTVFWMPRLVILSAVSVVFVFALRRLIPWLFAKGGIPIDRQALTILLVVFTLGFWLKAGGQLYPYMIAIDIHWHMERVRWILDGRLAEMYRPGAFNESVMPVREFGANRPTIPYSPFFHIFATSFAVLPWQLETTAKVFIAFLDATYAFIIYYVSQRIGFSRRSSLLSSAFYGVIPLTFLLQSWGNAPTAFGMWWVFITNAFIIGAWGRLREPKVFSALTTLLLITFLAYTVTAVFISLLLIVWMSLTFFQRRDQRPQVWAVVSASTVAFALSFGIYYAQYLPDIIAKTVPYFSQTLTQGQESVGAIRYQPTAADNFRAYVSRFWSYGLTVPALLTPLGLWLVGRWRQRQPQGHMWFGVLWICAMVVIALIFIPIDRNVPMVDKHVIWLLPVWSMLMSILMDTAVKRWRPSWLLVAASYAFLFFMAIELWIRRIETVKQEW